MKPAHPAIMTPQAAGNSPEEIEALFAVRHEPVANPRWLNNQTTGGYGCSEGHVGGGAAAQYTKNVLLY